ncbi:MAG: xanthine dehydrogenase family protein subunit M, partial [Chloroflexi bacterium]|nr:xanthine dehydrogenase family protein subunit M [Chloroflexota bacterium]
MNLWQQYFSPHSLPEAIQALKSAPGPVAPIAGGTDLLLDIQQGRHSPVHTLVDLSAVPELTELEERAGKLFIGAAAPLNRIARHPLVAQHAQALVEACDLVGGPQVRNVATLGGNVAHALPAADGTIALLALDAEAEIADATGTRRVPLSELFLGPGKSSLKHGEELLVGFYLPLMQSHQASCFKRIMRLQGVALPIINLAVRVSRQGNVVETTRIAVGPGAAIPWLAQQSEQELLGKPLSEQAIAAALEALLAHVGFRSSPRRASSEYRRHLVGTLFRETLETAWKR